MIKEELRILLESLASSLERNLNSFSYEIPPEWVKRSLLRESIIQNSLEVFVETGTYLGRTSAFLAKYVAHVATCENSLEVYRELEESGFLSSYSNVKTHLIDSVSFLNHTNIKNLIIEKPCLVFLDSHYSGGSTSNRNSCPLTSELNIILPLLNQKSILVVDDIHNMHGFFGYPRLSKVLRLIRKIRPDINYQIYSNMLFVYRRELNFNNTSAK
jgi:hypothetical protein